MHSKLFAVMAAVGMVLFALGPGVATAAAQTAGNDSVDISVTQDGEEPTVSVTDNGTGVANATVAVEALDNGSYDGVGEYTTDENGTVELPTPEENATVEATTTVDNVTVSTTADLTVTTEEEKESFGSVVAAFVQSLQEGNETNIGQQVADFVTSNNPGNAPDHAGPPDNAGPKDADDNETEDDRPGNAPEGAGPPEDRGNGNAGPPEGVGPSADDDDADEVETEEAETDEDEETDEVETEEAETDEDEETDEVETENQETDEVETEDQETDEVETEEAETDDADDGDSGGPPSNSNAGGNGGN